MLQIPGDWVFGAFLFFLLYLYYRYLERYAPGIDAEKRRRAHAAKRRDEECRNSIPLPADLRWTQEQGRMTEYRPAEKAQRFSVSARSPRPDQAGALSRSDEL